MRLISWNVNGLRACLTKTRYLRVASCGADAFCLQETKMQPGQADLCARGVRAVLEQCGKEGLFRHCDFTRKQPLSVQMGIGVEEHDHEGRVIALEFDRFFLVTVYTPNSQRGLTRLEYRMTWEGRLRGLSVRAGQTKTRSGMR